MRALEEALGSGGVELVRVSPSGLVELESQLGVSGMIQTLERFQRLVTDLLPPHFPLLKLPTGELIIALDSMMSSFFIRQISDAAKTLQRTSPSFVIAVKRGAPESGKAPASLEELLKPVERKSG
jgi:hypothetical protein